MTLRQIVTNLPFNKEIDLKQEIYQILSKFYQVALYAVVAFILVMTLNKMPINLWSIAQAKTTNPEKVAVMMETPNAYNFHSNTPEKAYFSTIKEVQKREIQALLSQGRVINMTVTAYNSEVGQCDSTPCITANGFNVCEHGIEDVIATNILPFGTKVMFPELFGDKVFTVQDRMNAKYSYRADIWMVHRYDAIQFGAKYNVKMVVLGK
jgi:3D (Asp-Asp-Asp) domain-containing protein